MIAGKNLVRLQLVPIIPAATTSSEMEVVGLGGSGEATWTSPWTTNARRRVRTPTGSLFVSAGTCGA